MEFVPIIDTPSQVLTVQLGGQNCKLSVYQKFTGLFMDVFVDDALIIGGVICENLNRIVRDLYLGFAGDFVFQDTQGNVNPTVPGLGSRFILIYLSTEDLAGAG